MAKLTQAISPGEVGSELDGGLSYKTQTKVYRRAIAIRPLEPSKDIGYSLFGLSLVAGVAPGGRMALASSGSALTE